MDTGDLIAIGITILILLCVTFNVVYIMGYNHGIKAILECETDMECEEIAHKVGL